MLLVERGSVDDGWLSRVPLLSQSFRSNDTRTISFQSQPQRYANKRQLELLTGSSVGGGSKIIASFGSKNSSME